jgi:hypothetical protein
MPRFYKYSVWSFCGCAEVKIGKGLKIPPAVAKKETTGVKYPEEAAHGYCIK